MREVDESQEEKEGSELEEEVKKRGGAKNKRRKTKEGKIREKRVVREIVKNIQ